MNTGGTSNNSVSKSQLFDFSGLTLSKQTKYEGVLNLIKTKTKDAKDTIKEGEYVKIHVCAIWKCLFKSFKGLSDHWKISELHKKNMKDVNMRNRMNEIEMEDDDDD